MFYASSQELVETCSKEVAVVNRLKDVQEGQDLVTDSYESKGGYAEDHIKGCALP